MNAKERQKQEKEIQTELEKRMGDFLQWRDEHYQHDEVPTFSEIDMARAALLILDALQNAYDQGAFDNR